IWNVRERPLRNRRFVYHQRGHLDATAMDGAAQVLVGRHDFAAFSGSTRSRERPTDTSRTLFRLHCWRVDERVLIDEAAGAFLPHMVRNLVGTLLRVGRGQATADDVSDVLSHRDRRLAGATAASRGLCLTRVWY